MLAYTESHWTDNATSPYFSTRIKAGNTMDILARATSMMKQLAIPADRITTLKSNVLSAASYDEAIGFVEKWFPVDRGE